MTHEIILTALRINPIKSTGKGLLATASITINQALVLDGIQLIRNSKGIRISYPKRQNWELYNFHSEIFRKTLIGEIWNLYYQQVQDAS